MAGVVELSDSVIESPQGLHSNAYTFSAKARLMICKAIGVPQMGQTTSLVGRKFRSLELHALDGGVQP
jgi:hypothetical protein